MKKLLLCAGVLAVMASCAKYDVDTPSVEKVSKGIVFNAGVAEEATRGGLTYNEDEKAWESFWYAEEDQIAIFAQGAVSATGTGETEEFDNTSKLYKATTSGRRGDFVAVDFANAWKYNYNTDAKQGFVNANFFAVTPASVASSVDFDDEEVTVTIATDNLATQTQTDIYGNGIFQNMLMWSLSSDVAPAASYEKVGETVKLDFQPELTVVRFSTEGVEEDYGFGALSTVKLTSKGYIAPANKTANKDAIEKGTYKHDETKGDIAPSKLTYGANAVLTVALEYDDEENVYYAESEGIAPADPKNDAGATEITWTGPAVENWTDENNAFVVIRPVDRKAYTTQVEDYAIEYNFENIDFKVAKTSSKSWVAGTTYKMPVLDINEYPYLVVGKEATGKILIVNKYIPAEMFAKNDGGIMWNGEPVAFNTFETIISNDAWGTELTKVAKFSALKNLTLNEDTTLPKGMLTNAQAAQLEKLVAPKVTTVNAEFTKGATDQKAAAFAKVTELNMASYEFPEDDINKYFFNDDEKGTLVKLNISGVESMFPKFNVNRTLAFENYTALTTVTVQDGVIVSPKAFKGCVKLATVNGKLDLTDATSAFEMPTGGNSALKSVNITNTNIPDLAFKNCKVLETVKDGSAAVVPSSVGKEAFWGCPKFAYMDLSKASTIGEKAFEYATSFAGKEKNNKLLTVGAETVGANAFGYTQLVNVQFTAAKTLNPGLFTGVTTLAQVQFDQKFTAASAAAWTGTFGKTPEKVDLFVVKDQTYVEGSYDLVLPTVSGNTKGTETITFKVIKKQ